MGSVPFSLSYDPDGLVVEKRLPGERTIGFAYDENGNITGITPPGKPLHEFGYTPVDLLEGYNPPDLASVPNDETQYDYNLDRQLELITRPDGQTIDYIYDETKGRLNAIELPGGQNGVRPRQ